MFSGGQQTNPTLSSATAAMCGLAFGQTQDATCVQNVTDMYNNNMAANADMYNAWVAYATARVYSDCAVAGAGQPARAAQCTEQAAAGSMVQLLGMDKPLEFVGTMYRYPDFFVKAKELAEQGVGPQSFDIADLFGIAWPSSRIQAMNELTGGDPVANEEVIRLYREALDRLPAADRTVAANQEAVARSILDQLKAEKTQGTDDTADDMTAEAFLQNLVVTYVDNVASPAAGQYVVGFRQMPAQVATDLSVDSANVTALREIRRLYVQVANQIKNDPVVAAHLLTLDAAGRAAYLDTLDTEIIANFIAPVRAVISGESADQIAGILSKYDAEAIYEMIGTTADISEIILKERVDLTRLLPPERLLIGLGADRDYPFRLAAIIRLWADVLEHAPAAAEPGALQDGLVDSLIAQHANTDTPTLRVTYVISVNEPGRRVVTGQRSIGLLDPLSPGLDIGAEDYQRIRLAQAAEQWWRDHNNGADPDSAAIDAAVRAMLRPILARITPMAGVLDYWDLPTIGIESITANGNGYLITANGGGAQGVGGDTIGTAVISDNFQIQFRGLFEGSVSVGTEGFGAYAYFKPELRFDWSSWSLSLFAAAMGVGSPDMFMNCGSESVCMDEGYTSIVRLANLYLQAGIDIGDADNAVKIAAGLISLRSAWLTDAFSDPYNTQFNAHPTLGASTGAGGRVDLTMPLGTSDHVGATTLRVGVIAGQQYSLNITGDGSDAREGTTDLGVYGAASVLLHPDSKLHLTLGLGGDYGFDDTYRVTINGGLDVQPWEHLVIAPGAYYSFSTSNSQPYDRSAWDVAAYLRFPFNGISGSILGLTPYVGFNYGTNMTGSAGLGGLRVDDNSCTSISCPPVGAESADYGNRVLVLDFGMSMAIGEHGNIGIGGTYARPESQDENAGAENIFAGSLFGSATW